MLPRSHATFSCYFEHALHEYGLDSYSAMRLTAAQVHYTAAGCIVVPLNL